MKSFSRLALEDKVKFFPWGIWDIAKEVQQEGHQISFEPDDVGFSSSQKHPFRFYPDKALTRIYVGPIGFAKSYNYKGNRCITVQLGGHIILFFINQKNVKTEKGYPNQKLQSEGEKPNLNWLVFL